ncbi:beta-ketoacyl synthase N-terminal-like domain-containing protein [Alkaliphilus peptidifermentans]|uniref:Nodulation protein E n=1 Tax=Alkaliphilus peptidifermentans DSM 18978 TaxID=1120976 RepID=A0A1G5I2V1_9FIRM|nr:beta-ketoacyl synthase N-terminal-like domain-containing protein [Alkaliphilus peptidifermentans]SCY70352.1 3-oxoacyl-(acyl-carrier-protein) synthase [Alkaliphilus peptidifermentans DSM 18978]
MRNRENNIFITGVGVVSIFGNSLNEFWTGLMRQDNIPIHVEYLKKSGGENTLGLPADMPVEDNQPADRILEMGEKAIYSAIKDWGGNLSDYKRICLVVGSGLGFSDCFLFRDDLQNNKELLSTLGERLAGFVDKECRNVYIANACCAGAQAISYGMDLLELNRYDLVIAGGIDILSNIAYSGFLRLNSIDFMGCRPFDRDRKGIATGEGAAFFVLEKQREAYSKKPKVYCELVGSGITNDAYHVVQMKNDGRQILRAMEEALEASGMTRGDIDLVVTHGTGTIQNDIIEANTIETFFKEDLINIHVTAPKGAIGHTGGASGAFGLLTAVGSICHECVPPICNFKEADNGFNIPLVGRNRVQAKVSGAMVNTFAFGGTNVIIVCKNHIGSDYVG